MTSDEICNSTPWEIKKMINGYEDRQRYNRIVLANFVSLPIYNSGFSRPKKGFELKDILPKEDLQEEITQKEIDVWREILNKARKGGNFG